jgi:uncharacterized membrane protein
MSNTGPLGQHRGVGFVIVLSIVTLGIYFLYWTYKTFEEMKQHTGEGLGGVIGLVIGIVIGIVNYFVIPSEVGKMFKGDGQEAPVSGMTGFWVLIPLAGFIIWAVKVQGSLNRYWAAKGTGEAAPAPAPTPTA